MAFIQRVYAVIEAGEDKFLMGITPTIGPVDIDPRQHFRNEEAIAKALRILADQIEKGVSFKALPGFSLMVQLSQGEEQDVPSSEEDRGTA